MANPTKLVVGFDIGTTYSSVSYSFLEVGQVPEVLAVAKFPAQGVACSDARVPSLLYYEKSGIVKAAGAEVLAEHVIEAALAEGWSKVERWKLHLHPNHLASSINQDIPPLPPGVSAAKVLSDFIEYLFRCVKIYIQECHPTFIWPPSEDSIEYVFTHPSGWDAQRRLYHQAIVDAGLIPNTPEAQSRVHVLTEGEASLYFCFPGLANVETTKKSAPRGVVIIDAGGGTIDLSMFSMTSSPISYEEVVPAESQLQGSVFVTARAEALLQRKLEGWEHSSAEDMAKIAREFDQTTKLVIESDQEPAYIRVAGRRTNSEQYCISSGKLKLSGEEATSLFNDSINAVINAFERRQKSVTIPITTAFLVGGLSENDWVWSQLQSYFKARDIEIHRPDNYICKAVANGAVLSFVSREEHLRTPCSTYDVDSVLPTTAVSEERAHRKKTLGDIVRRNFTRVLMLARKCRFRGFFSLTNRNTTGPCGVGA